MPISAVDAITLAFQHTKRQLIEPFRFWQWTRLALVGLLAGEMNSGGFNFPSGIGSPQQGGSFPHVNAAFLAALITALVSCAIVFALAMMYVSSIMRFILFDGILARECRIRQGWRRRQAPGWRYFLWQLGFSLLTFAAIAILIGIPAILGFALGWFNAPRQHLAGLILGGISLFILISVLLLAVGVVHVLTKDFVVPQMAMEDISAIEGWRRLWAMIEAEKSGYAIYVGMKIVLSIGAGIVIGLVSLVLTLLIAIPAVGLGIIAVITGKGAGLTWNVFTITVAVVVASILFALLMYLSALISVPAIVFFPAYSIYFFAPRYRPLSLALYPPLIVSPLDIPPMTPSPEPTG